jgi:SAM-dependent MidA family methyltransferase
MSLLSVLHRYIASAGPMPFEEFMSACLYDPEYGFFATGPLRSTKAGDFLTSPEASPAFGAMLARHVATERERLGGGPFTLVEVGAGSGSLLEPLLGALDAAPDAVAAIEASPAARSALTDRLPSVDVYEYLDDLAHPIKGVVIANEVLDNAPVRLAVRTAGGWEERYVGVGEEGALALVAAPARPETVAWADAYGGAVPEGGLIEVQLEAAALLVAVLGRLEAGSVVAINYGGTAEELEPRRTRGTLRTYRAHHVGPDPLLEPGSTDITVDVNFTAMAATARAEGAHVEIHRQDDFLVGMGLRDHIQRLRAQELAVAGDPARAIERLRLRSERTDAETLLHPRGLGDFRVLVMRR